MEIKINKNITIKTFPYNWVIIENKKDPTYFNDFKDVQRHLSHRVSKSKLSLVLDEVMSLLHLSRGESLSAWHLTKIKRHPDFTKKVSLNSLVNLKNKPNLSAKNKHLEKIRAGPRV